MEDKIKTPENEQNAQDAILDLNFVPQWARKPPGVNHYGTAGDTREFRRDGRDGKQGRAADRPARGERRRESRSRADRSRGQRSDRGDRFLRGRGEHAPVQQLPVQISFIPEQKRLASLVRQIHHSRRAYPLIDLANLFLQNAEAYMVKIEVEPEARDFVLFQCKFCRQVASSREIIIQHLISKHIEDVYEKEEIETDPPIGQFICVARCRKTGVLLGPPNHHSYVDKLNELHQTRFPHLTLEEYKRNIEILHDEELINQWKEESRKKTVYRKKADPKAEPVDLRAAEADFMRQIDNLFEETRRAILPSVIAQKTEDRNIKHAIRKVWQKESHFPLTLSFAMRAAFRHMRLHVFKAGNINFVTHIKPRAIKPEDTIESIGEVLRCLREHPGSTRRQLLNFLRPAANETSPEAAEVLEPLSWLIERGYIIEFFNGTLSVPLGRKK